MALTIEDGSIVADANSYVTATEAKAYADARGLSLPTADADVEKLLIQAMDYLEAKRAEYQGDKTDPSNQELQWPRTGVKIDCNDLASNVIPKELKQAQIVLAIEKNSGTDLQPTRSEGFVKKEVVGPIETEYSEKIGVSVEPTITAVDALLTPLFNACGQRFTLTTLRV